MELYDNVIEVKILKYLYILFFVLLLCEEDRVIVKYFIVMDKFFLCLFIIMNYISLN